MSKKRIGLEFIVYLCLLAITLGIGIPFGVSARPIFKIIIFIITILFSILWLFFIIKAVCRLLTLKFGQNLKCKCLEISKEQTDHEVGMGRTPEYLSIKYESNYLKSYTDIIPYNNLTKSIKVGDEVPVRFLGKLHYIDYDCLLNKLASKD